MAYGAKGIQWWAWRPYNDDAANINAQLKVLGLVLIELRSVSSVTMLDRKTGKWAERPLTRKGAQHALSHKLAPGDGMLLRVIRDRQRREGLWHGKYKHDAQASVSNYTLGLTCWRVVLGVSRRCCWLSRETVRFYQKGVRDEIKSYSLESKLVWKSSLEPRKRLRGEGRKVTTGD